MATREDVTMFAGTRRTLMRSLAAVAVLEMLGKRPASAHSACHCSRGCFYYMCKIADCTFGGYRICQWENTGRDAKGCVKWVKVGCGYSSTGGLCDRFLTCTADMKPPSSCNVC